VRSCALSERTSCTCASSTCAWSHVLRYCYTGKLYIRCGLNVTHRLFVCQSHVARCTVNFSSSTARATAAPIDSATASLSPGADVAGPGADVAGPGADVAGPGADVPCRRDKLRAVSHSSRARKR
jgi:hypothetical protein